MRRRFMSALVALTLLAAIPSQLLAANVSANCGTGVSFARWALPITGRIMFTRVS